MLLWLTGILKELVDRMHDYMETIADEAYSLLSESFSHIFEEIEASREPERFKKIFESYTLGEWRKEEEEDSDSSDENDSDADYNYDNFFFSGFTAVFAELHEDSVEF